MHAIAATVPARIAPSAAPAQLAAEVPDATAHELELLKLRGLRQQTENLLRAAPYTAAAAEPKGGAPPPDFGFGQGLQEVSPPERQPAWAASLPSTNTQSKLSHGRIVGV